MLNKSRERNTDLYDTVIRTPIKKRSKPCSSVRGEFVRIGFCVEANCKHLQLERIQCRLRPKVSRITTRMPATRLQHRWKEGWYYRDLPKQR